jgi:hypothetical protein
MSRSLPPNFHEHDGGAVPHPWLLWPAYILLPFVRGPIGYGLMHPLRVLVTAGLLTLWPLVIEFLYVGITAARLPENIGHRYLIAFAALYAVLSLLIFARRLIGQRMRENVHTWSAGHSWLSRHTRLPVVLCETLIMPALVGALGWSVLKTFSLELGGFLVAGALSLALMGWWEHVRWWATQRAGRDDEIRARTYEDRINPQGPASRGGGSSGADEPEFADLAGGRGR